MSEWLKDEAGLITLRPLSGYETAVVAGTACALRLEHVSGREGVPEPSVLQLVLTPVQARALAGALTRMADRAEAPPPPGTLKN